MTTFVDINAIITQLQSSSGSEFFENITLQLHTIIGADYTFISKVDFEAHTSTTICLVDHGEVADNFTYSLDHTPCSDVSNDDVCIYEQKVCDLYPKDQLLIDMKIEGYIGTPLHDSGGKILGIIVAMYESPIAKPKDVAALFQLFSGRIAAEVERAEKQKELVHLNERLELMVEERTRDLSSALEQLKSTQKQIIEQEKMASIGRLVVSLAHEVNTPLGTSILANSSIGDLVEKVLPQIEQGNISRSSLLSALKEIQEYQSAVTANILRASDLVSSFKKISVEQHSDEISRIAMRKWFGYLCNAFLPTLNDHDIALNIDWTECPEQIVTRPSHLLQALTQIFTNCYQHGFSGSVEDDRAINVSFKCCDAGFDVLVADNGVGMTPDVLEKATEPFFTGSLATGGAGLGLSIASNLVQVGLQGSLLITSHQGQGTCVRVRLPKRAIS